MQRRDAEGQRDLHQERLAVPLGVVGTEEAGKRESPSQDVPEDRCGAQSRAQHASAQIRCSKARR